ncbi:MAG TPA: hypothetical protein VMV41_12345 [Cellulomonadaceae bacterium]|nr:hypothetical protein [Cellulomonadaceae bacterium]
MPIAEDLDAPMLKTSGGGREVEIVVPAGSSGRNYPDVLRALGLGQLAPGEGSVRVDVVLVKRGETITVKSAGRDVGVIPAARFAVTAKAMASVPADVVRVRAKLWRSAKDRTYGLRVYLPWGLKPADQ